MSQAAFVNPSILTWSRERAGLSAAQVARKLPVKPERVVEWEAGEAKPTFLQAQKWASVAHVPFGFLSFCNRLLSCSRCQTFARSATWPPAAKSGASGYCERCHSKAGLVSGVSPQP
ncbi:helix-turn-helix transcriptional regulator [Pseudomonas syringae]|nr:helix-turn-helix transcriptional regulator [Pseudomonas syringae]